MADKIKMEYMIMDSMTSEFRKMGGNLDNIIKDLNKILVSLELSYISAASLIMCQNITDSLKLGKQITNNIYKLSIKLNGAKAALAKSDKDLAAAMGLASGAVLYRGNADENLDKVLKETDKTTKEVDGFLKEFDKEEEMEKKAWYNRPAKEDIFDKIEYWVTGKKPRVRTQGEEVIASQYTEMAFSNQNFAAELQSEFEIGARGIASMDRINEVMENSEEMPVVNVGKNTGISKTGIGKTGEGIHLEEVKAEVLKQIHPDDNGAYGYLPNEGTAYHKPEYDFTDVDWTKEMQNVRKDYLEASKQLEIDIERMTSEGFSKEDIAKHVVDARNQQKVTARANMTAEERVGLEARNIELYGNPIGPDSQWLFNKTKKKLTKEGSYINDDEIWSSIIKKSMKKDDVINTLLGLIH
ncbi:hypothetical protein [Clostridium felsineum]|uniref:hypothetical protein n=1 Tax=Clostridium felsineum TaxID=36839 RepID=UPI0009CB2719|nr:hypothetical protein [Clostridium felsineum]URZ04107.1 hypothetical protein CLAUR_041950 [Clostridium felsineum]